MSSETQALQTREQIDHAILEQVVVGGDLSKLNSQQRVSYYNALCQSLGLNPLTKPFEYIKDKDGKLFLYARKDCTEQLRTKRNVSITDLEMEIQGDLLIVTAYASLPDGRRDVDRGVVYLKGIFGDNLANAYLRCVTKAKRRVTLSICGLGILDESEVDTIRSAERVESDGLTVHHKSSGLDQWQCTRATAMAVLKVCERLKAAKATDEQIKAKLPPGVTSRKDLTEEQAKQLVNDLQALYFELTRQQSEEIHEGEVVNG